MLSTDDYWPVLNQNLWQVRGKWVLMVRILGREGADRRTAGRFYVLVVQAVLLFRSDIWVVTLQLEKALAGFHHQAIRRMAGMGPECKLYGTWVYTPI